MCRTDYSIIVGENWVEVRMWHDLGDEGDLIKADWPDNDNFGARGEHGRNQYKGSAVRRTFEAGHDFLEHSLDKTWMQDTRDLKVSCACEEWRLGRDVFKYIG